ncbi:MAG: hypothetical protein Q9161_003873 [Pseudevernia consocians]
MAESPETLGLKVLFEGSKPCVDLVSANSGGSDFQYLALSTVGIVFLGTPHRGTPAARWGEIVVKSTKALGFGSENSILKDLGASSESLIDLLYNFGLWANRASVTLVCFFEQHPTDYGKRFHMKWKELVVDETSACIDGYRKVPLPTDHLKINKFSGPDDPSYLAVYPLIVDMAQKAGQKVQDRRDPQKIVKDNSRIPNANLECLESLFLSDPQDDLAAIRSAKGDRVDGTCEWILTQDQYTSWLVEDSPKLLWLSGGPGIGKTMISSFLVEELAQLAEQSSQMMLAYYFCDDKDERRRTATAILRGLLLQLLRQRPILFKHIQSQFNEARDRLFTNFHAMWRIFVSIAQNPEVGEICCLIDALDECEEESRQLLLTNLEKLFCSQQSKKTFAKLIVTSRPNNDIVESLSAVSPTVRRLHIDSGRVNKDLTSFIEIKTDDLSNKKRFDSKTKQSIKHTLMEKAGGTFLYVSLVLHDLKKVKITSQVPKRLRKLPSDLNNLYDRILSQIDADCVEIAKLVLCWVAVARRPLTVEELAMASVLGTEEWEKNTTPPDDLLNQLKDGFKCCEPLVYLNEDANTINLVHQSAKDYLLGKYLQEHVNLSKYHIITDKTNLLMFRTCWTYLSLADFKQGTVIVERQGDRLHEKFYWLSSEFKRDHCLLWYASQEWQKHALAAGPALATDHEFWKYDLAKLPTLRDMWLVRAAAEGQEVIVKLLLSRDDVVVNSQGRYYQTPLSLAAERGHEIIVKLLLSRDDVVVNSENKFKRTPLSLAAEEGHKVIVKLLLSRDDVVVNCRDLSDRTPLLLAAKNGHKAVVELLLSRDDVAVNSQDYNGKTPLLLAAENGHEAVMKLLLSRDDVAVNTQDTFGEIPLSFAAQNGYRAVVKLLLSRDDVAVNTQDTFGETPLSLAAMFGHEAVVQLLERHMRQLGERRTEDVTDERS